MNRITLTLKDEKTKVTLNKNDIVDISHTHRDFYTVYYYKDYTEYYLNIINDSKAIDDLIKEALKDED